MTVKWQNLMYKVRAVMDGDEANGTWEPSTQAWLARIPEDAPRAHQWPEDDVMRDPAVEKVRRAERALVIAVSVNADPLLRKLVSVLVSNARSLSDHIARVVEDEK